MESSESDSTCAGLTMAGSGFATGTGTSVGRDGVASVSSGRTPQRLTDSTMDVVRGRLEARMSGRVFGIGCGGSIVARDLGTVEHDACF